MRPLAMMPLYHVAHEHYETQRFILTTLEA